MAVRESLGGSISPAVHSSLAVLKAGCRCLPVKDGAWSPEARKNAPIVDGVLASDYETNAPLTAAWVVLGHAANGWVVWHDSQNKPIDRYRKRKRD